MGFVYILVSLIGLIIFVYLVLSFRFFRLTLIPKKESNWDFMLDHIKRKDYKWAYLDMEFEKLEIKSRFNYPLYARLYKTEKPSHKWIIDSHGWTSKGIGQIKYVDLFRELGYNVLVVDHRYSTESGGKCISFSYFEKFDVISWIDEIQKRDDKATFGIFGESMGAATAIYVTSLDSRIKFLISYCSYTSVPELFKELLLKKLPEGKKKYTKLLLTVFVPFKILSRFVYKVDIASIDTREAMKKINVPCLVMHSKADKLIDIKYAYDLLAVNPNAEYLEFEESQHSLSYARYPEKFKSGVQNFIRKVEK